jgi:hypothetical protein
MTACRVPLMVTESSRSAIFMVHLNRKVAEWDGPFRTPLFAASLEQK